MPFVGPEATEEKSYSLLAMFPTLINVGAHDKLASYAFFSKAFCKFIDANPDEHLAQHIVLTSMSPCVVAATLGKGDTPYHLQILKKLDMSVILRTTARCIAKPFSCATCVMNGTVLIASSTLAARTTFEDVPEALNVLVAGLQSYNWSIRAACLRALNRFHTPGSEEEPGQINQLQLLLTLLSGSMPQELRDAQEAFGLERCASVSYLSYVQSFSQAMADYIDDHDLHSLALKLYSLALNSDVIIPDGRLTKLNPTTGAHEPYTVQRMPFYRYKDSASVCAKAIRDGGNPSEQHIANVLTIQAEVINGRGLEAISLAKKYIASGSYHAFYYMILTLNGADSSANIIQAAKKGLKCTEGLTPHIKLRLLERSVHFSANLGVDKLQEAHRDKSDELLQLGKAIIKSAFADTRQYLDEAPPDARSVKEVLYWFVLLRIFLTEDPIITLPDDIKASRSAVPDLACHLTHCSFQSALEKLRIADGFSKLIFGSDSPQTPLRRTMDTVLDKLRESNTRYGEVFRRTSKPKISQIAPYRLRHIFTPMLDQMTERMDKIIENAWNNPASGPRDNPLRLYQCAHCMNPSVVTRKCDGCSKVRYVPDFRALVDMDWTWGLGVVCANCSESAR